MDNLKALQLAETEMLKIFDQVCQKYKIDYFVLFGTALGVARHQGFIPWDDDIDVGMLRSDYERLKRVPIEEWDGLMLVDPGEECFYHEKVFPRLYKPGTVLEFEQWKKYVYNPDHILKPVWIDIFLFDHVDSKEEAQLKAKKARRLNMRYFYSKYDTNIVSSDSIKNKVRSLAKKGMHIIFRTLHKPEYYLKKYYHLVMKEKGEYLISFDSWRYGTIMDSFGEKELYYPVNRMKFDYIEVCAPNNIDKFLTQRFGDYKKLPPEDQRKSHTPCQISL